MLNLRKVDKQVALPNQSKCTFTDIQGALGRFRTQCGVEFPKPLGFIKYWKKLLEGPSTITE
ncbi:hypothetical protein LMG33818_000687 [Halomonadaceae bacterium LMG 33818]